MTVIIACGQFDILGEECAYCGSWLHCHQRGGFRGPDGWWYCSEDCIADQKDFLVRQHIAGHNAMRDLLCACEICTANGLPTQAMLDEYADYVASIKGTSLDPAVTT